MALINETNSPLFNWREITGEFKSACSELNIGELIKDDNFGLFEAMSAIEMMDIKMDAGMIQNQYISKIKSFKQAVDDKLVKVSDFTFEEKIAIVDNTLCNLVTWLDGSSLAQTLFTNLYLHEPSLVDDQFIRVFAIATLKLIELIRNKIVASATFEEEDFQPMHYNFKFACDVTDAETSAQLKMVEDSSAKLYRHFKGELTPDMKGFDQIEKKQLQIDLAFALWTRIKFIRSLYLILHYSDEYNSYNGKNSEDINKHINNCLECLAKINDTHKLGVDPEIVKVGKTTYPLVIGFEPCINQRLLPPTFPRFIRIFSFDSTSQQVHDTLRKVSELMNKSSEWTTFNLMFDFGLEFNRSQQSVLSRSMFQLIALPRSPIEKIIKMKEILLNTVQKFINPPSLHSKLPLANREMMNTLIDNFMNKCDSAFISLVQILGHNKARQREKFGHILLDFAGLQDDADNLDRILHQILQTQQKQLPGVSHLICFGSWILTTSLSVMKLYLLYGFELELYSKYEYHYIYWYLGEIINNWQISTLSRVSQFLQSQELTVAAAAVNVKGAKKANKKKNKLFYEREISLLTAEKQMFLAYYQSFRALKLEGHIKSANEEFDCEEFRFNHRFSPFQYFATPQVCMYFQYKERDDQYVSSCEPRRFYSLAQENFDSARAVYEKFPEQTKCTKISKNNFIAMRLLSSGLKKADKLIVDFADHEHFPLIRI